MRMEEYNVEMRNNLATSDIAKHMNSQQHVADFTNVETVGNDSV